MLRSFTRRASEPHPSTSVGASADTPDVPPLPSKKAKTFAHRKTASKAKVTLNTSNGVKTISKSAQKPSNLKGSAKQSQDAGVLPPRPVTKKNQRFASLFVSMLATTPIAIEESAVDEKTVDNAKRTAVGQQPSKSNTEPIPAPPQQPEKAHVSEKPNAKATTSVRAAELRKTRWKRFRYEMGLKFHGGKAAKTKEKKTRTWMTSDEVELKEMTEEERARAQKDGRLD